MRARRLGRRPGQLFGLSVGKRGATTLAIQRSLSGAWTMGQSVYRALTADSTATRNIQGARGARLRFGSSVTGYDVGVYRGIFTCGVPLPGRALAACRAEG